MELHWRTREVATEKNADLLSLFAFKEWGCDTEIFTLAWFSILITVVLFAREFPLGLGW